MSKELVDLELSDDASEASDFFMELASTNSFVSIFFILIAFVVLYIVAAARSPSSLSSKDDYFPFTSLAQRVPMSFDLNLTISFVRPPRSLAMHISLFRQRAVQDPLTMSLRISLLATFHRASNFTVVSGGPRMCTLFFPANSTESSSFALFNRDSATFDSVVVNLTLYTASFDGVDGLTFRSLFSDLSVWMFQRVSFCLMSGLFLYMFALYLCHLKSNFKWFTRTFCVILGVAGIAAGNPLALVCGPSAIMDLVSNGLVSLYIGLFRLFCVLQLELCARKKSRPISIVYMVMTVYFGAFAVVDSLPNKEQMSLVFHVGYSLLAVVVMAVAWMSRKASPRRVAWFSFLLAADVLGYWVSAGLAVMSRPFKFSIVPEIVRAALPLTAGALSVFLLHGNDGQHYERMDRAAGKDQGLIIEDMSGEFGAVVLSQ